MRCKNKFITTWCFALPFRTRFETSYKMGQEVSFFSPEDLMIHKIFAGRSRDFEDVRSVILKNPTIDFVYMRRWLKEFDASTEEKKDFSKAE